jgi:hypothetical protein
VARSLRGHWPAMVWKLTVWFIIRVIFRPAIVAMVALAQLRSLRSPTTHQHPYRVPCDPAEIHAGACGRLKVDLMVMVAKETQGKEGTRYRDAHSFQNSRTMTATIEAGLGGAVSPRLRCLGSADLKRQCHGTPLMAVNQSFGAVSSRTRPRTIEWEKT